MSASCVSPGQMQAFLAGELSPDLERAVADHVDGCRRCERLAAEFSDDRRARTLAAANSRRADLHTSDAATDDLRRRLHALALYEPAPGTQDDTQSAYGKDAGGTAIERRGAVVETSSIQPPTDDAAEPDAPRLTHLGHYRILRTLGYGTFGVVYLAEDQRLHRQVAVKVARTNVLVDAELRVRFFREAETLARLSHPHIVPVYEVDEVDGLCFLAMAFCDGPTLEAWLEDQGAPLDSQLAAQLVLPLVEAVKHAHAHGILHRDIKPGNILLRHVESGSELPVIPQLTDFGLAKVVEEQTSATLSGIVLGTPQYMAPEQAAGLLERIGPATDVYALGAVLYQMLTGRPPIEGNSAIDTLRRLLIDEPTEVRRLVGTVSEDLDAIVMKCLEKSPAQRYATADELAADLGRFLEGRPTKARPLSSVQRAERWVRRNPMLTALLALAAAVVGLSLGLLNYAQRLSNTQDTVARELEKSAVLSRQSESRAESIAQRDYANDIRIAGNETFRGNTAHAVAALRKQFPAPDSKDLRGLEWYYLWAWNSQQSLADANAGCEIYQIRLSPDQRELAAVGSDGLLRLYDPLNLTLQAIIPAGQGELNSVAYSPDARLAATAGDDGTIRVWDLASRRPRLTIAAHPEKAYGVVFYDGANKLASCGDDPLVRLWDATTGNSLGTLVGHTAPVEAIDLSPDGKLLASASSDKTAIVWNMEDGQAVRTLQGHEGRLSSICFSPNGQWVATGSLDHSACLWDIHTGRRLSVEFHLDAVQTVAFSRDGSRLYVGDRSGTLRNYRVAHRAAPDPRVKLVLQSPDDAWLAHTPRVWSVAPGMRRRAFYTAGKDGLVRRWAQDSLERMQRIIPETADDLFADLDFTADGKLLFVLRESSGVTALDAVTLQPRLSLDTRHSEWRSLEILEGRDEVAAGNAHGLVAIWNWKTGELQHLLYQHDEKFTVADLVYSPKAGLLAVLPYEKNDVRLYDPQTGQLVARLPTNNHNAVAFSPDGRRLAVDSLNNILLYDVATGQQLHVLSGHSSTVNSLAFSPGGQTLASGSSDRTVRVWSSDSGQLLHTLTEHYAALTEVRFTPDGKTLITMDDAGVLKIVLADTWRAPFDIPAHTDRLRALALAPDNRRLAVIRAAHDILLISTQAKP